MRDGRDRVIHYLRISVTDRCNFRCAYCMPPEGVKPLDHSEILRYEEILRVVKIAAAMGFDKVRLTGGEPLVRQGIVDLVREIAAIKAVGDLSMTTNGSLLAPMAPALKAAGLNRVNISLDTGNRPSFARITGQDALPAVLEGIRSAFAAGLVPIKINVALTQYFTPDDLAYFIDWALRYPVSIRFIEYMPIGMCRVQPGESVASIKRVLNEIGLGHLEYAPVEGGSGPAKYYRLPKAKGMFGFITPITDHFCGQCNRIRLTADGKLKPCLLSDQEIDVKTALRAGAGDDAIAMLLRQAVYQKPAGHTLEGYDEVHAFQRSMSQIGG